MFKGLFHLVLLGCSLGSIWCLDICAEQKDGARLVHPGDCSRFIVCENGITAHIKYCPYGLHFSRVEGICDYKYRAGCDVSYARQLLAYNEATKQIDCYACRAVCTIDFNDVAIIPSEEEAENSYFNNNKPAKKLIGSGLENNRDENVLDNDITKLIGNNPSEQKPRPPYPTAPTPRPTPPGHLVNKPSGNGFENNHPGNSSENDKPGKGSSGNFPNPQLLQAPSLPLRRAKPCLPKPPPPPPPPPTRPPPCPSTSQPKPTPPPPPSTPKPCSPSSTPKPSTRPPPPPSTRPPPPPSTRPPPPPSTRPPPPPSTPKPCSPSSTRPPPPPSSPKPCSPSSTPPPPPSTPKPCSSSSTSPSSPPSTPKPCIPSSTPKPTSPPPKPCDPEDGEGSDGGNPSSPPPPQTESCRLSCDNRGKCEGQRDGALFADDASSGYIVCQCQCQIFMPCPEGLVFSNEKQVCDWPQ